MKEDRRNATGALAVHDSIAPCGLYFRWAQLDQELHDELHDHLERTTQDYVAKGIEADEAHRRATGPGRYRPDARAVAQCAAGGSSIPICCYSMGRNSCRRP